MDRKRKAETKYTPLREVLEGKRVILVEDSIVRATTMQRAAAADSRNWAGPRKSTSAWPARPLSPPVFTASTCRRSANFSPRTSLKASRSRTRHEAEMAAQLGADSLRYLPVDAIARAIGIDADHLCRACITGEYPTPCGQHLAQVALDNYRNNVAGRTYERATQRFLANALSRR